MQFHSTPPDFVPPSDPLREVIDRLRRHFVGIMAVQEVRRHKDDQSFTFAGILQLDPQLAFDEIQHRLHPLGYAVMLHGDSKLHLLFVTPSRRRRTGTGNPLINIILFLLTIGTTLAAGAGLSDLGLIGLLQTWLAQEPMPAFSTIIQAGLPFTLAIMGILGVHEFGHYALARWHGVAATLPYFIPIPLGRIGTMGAFIALRSPMKNRRVLFDIGIAGPLAGFVVALPLLALGLWLSPVESKSLHIFDWRTLDNAGTSLLIDGAVRLLKDVPRGHTIVMHPILFGAWLGLLVTGINLLPVGQLDGGHVAYALFGKWAHRLAMGVFVLLIIAGIFWSSNWLVWAIFILFGGLRHPPPLDDLTRLNLPRQLLGWSAVILFILVVVPMPFG